jgi:hypothetical protein
MNVSIQPVGLRAEDLSHFYGSELVAKEILKGGYLKPVRKGNRLTIYDVGEATVAWVKWCSAQRLNA